MSEPLQIIHGFSFILSVLCLSFFVLSVHFQQYYFNSVIKIDQNKQMSEIRMKNLDIGQPARSSWQHVVVVPLTKTRLYKNV